MDTREVVARAIAGDGKALEDLCQRFRPLVISTVRKVIGARFSPFFEDLLQEAWLSLFETLSRCKTPEEFLCKVKKGVHFGVLNALPRMLGRNEVPLEFEPAQPEDSKAQETSHKIPPAEQILASLDGMLSPREREVLRLWLSGCGIKKTARMLGISPSTVETLRKRILKKAREKGQGA